MEAFFWSVLKDAAVAVVVAVLLAAVKRLLPRLGWDKEPVAPPPPKSFVVDVFLFVMRITVIMTACWIPVFCILVERRADSVVLSDARFVGRYLPSLVLGGEPFGSQFMELVLLLVVPFSIAERAVSWVIETWGRSRGYVSERFMGWAKGLSMLVVALALAAHLYYVFSTVSYASAWVRTMVGAAVIMVAMTILDKLGRARKRNVIDLDEL